VELQSLRHLMSVESVAVKKFNMLSQQAIDPQFKTFLQNSALKSDQNYRVLMGYLQ
jgi:hypothetical protein